MAYGTVIPFGADVLFCTVPVSYTHLDVYKRQTVDNSFDGTLLTEDGNFVSTKHDHDALGLKSVKNIADKYNGSASFESRGGMFYSAVMLTNNSRQ